MAQVSEHGERKTFRIGQHSEWVPCKARSGTIIECLVLSKSAFKLSKDFCQAEYLLSEGRAIVYSFRLQSRDLHWRLTNLCGLYVFHDGCSLYEQGGYQMSFEGFCSQLVTIKTERKQQVQFQHILVHVCKPTTWDVKGGGELR